jgi:hypothetical protein
MARRRLIVLFFQHPFAVGVTLSSFTAVSVDESWKPAFIEGSSKTVHKVSWLIDSSSLLSTPHSWQSWNLWPDILIQMPKAWPGSLMRLLWNDSLLWFRIPI